MHQLLFHAGRSKDGPARPGNPTNGVTTLKLVLGSLLAIGTLGTASAAVNCAGYPHNTINNFVNDTVEAIGITRTNGPSGSVNVTVDMPGLVKGNIHESDSGQVLVNARDGSFESSIMETGRAASGSARTRVGRSRATLKNTTPAPCWPK